MKYQEAYNNLYTFFEGITGPDELILLDAMQTGIDPRSKSHAILADLMTNDFTCENSGYLINMIEYGDILNKQQVTALGNILGDGIHVAKRARGRTLRVLRLQLEVAFKKAFEYFSVNELLDLPNSVTESAQHIIDKLKENGVDNHAIVLSNTLSTFNQFDALLKKVSATYQVTIDDEVYHKGLPRIEAYNQAEKEVQRLRKAQLICLSQTVKITKEKQQ